MCGTIGTVNGRDNVAAMIGTFIAALPDLKATEQVVVAEGDYVFVWGVVEGTHRGDLFGVPPAGGKLLAFDNPGSRGWGISLPRSGTVPEHIRSVQVLRAVPGLSKLAVLSWRSSRGLWLSDTFAAACLHGQWWRRTEPGR